MLKVCLNGNLKTKTMRLSNENKTANTNLDHLYPLIKKIPLPTIDHILYTRVDHIIRCKGDNNYTHFYLIDNSDILVSRTLKEYETCLVNFGFVRTHQSHLINIHHVKKYIRKDGGYLVMTDDNIIPISRSKKEDVLLSLSQL